MSERYKSVAAVYTILEKDGKYLLLRRLNTGYLDGDLSLPAGHLDSGESTILGAIREAKEEVGVEIRSEDMTFVHVLDRNAEDFHRLDFFFHCTKWAGEVTNCEPEKCSELAWIPKEQVKDEIADYLKPVFAAIEEQGTYTSQGW